MSLEARRENIKDLQNYSRVPFKNDRGVPGQNRQRKFKQTN